MTEKLAPFYLHGEFVGCFDSIVCEICNYSLLTSVGYDEAMKAASKIGLVGPVEDVVSESMEIKESSYILEKNRCSSNIDRESQVFSISGEKMEVQSVSASGEMPSFSKYIKQQHSKITQILAITK